MGLEKKIRKAMRDIVTPSAFSVIPSNRKGTIHIEDALTRINPMAYRDEKMTGRELFDRVWAPIAVVLADSFSAGYVLLVDDRLNVIQKQAKKEEHMRRQKATARSIIRKNQFYAAKAAKETKETGVFVEPKKDESNKPYKAGAILKDEGLVWPVERTTGNKEEEEEKDPVPFHLARLLCGDRRIIWDYFVSKLQHRQIPRKKIVVFESSAVGPWIATSAGCAQYPQLAHDHGESDLSILYYMWYFRKHPIRIITTDTDLMALAMVYLQRCHLQAKLEHRDVSEVVNPAIEWVYVNQEKTPLKRFGLELAKYYVVDMVEMYRQMSKRWSGFHFYLACVLSGTDHYNKQLITSGYGWEIIFEAVSILHEIKDPFIPCVFNRKSDVIKDVAYQMRRFRLLVTMLAAARKAKGQITRTGWIEYSGKLTRSAFIQSFKGSLPVEGDPEVSDVAYETASIQLLFVMDYWCRDWKKYQMKPRFVVFNDDNDEEDGDDEVDLNDPNRVLFLTQ